VVLSNQMVSNPDDVVLRLNYDLFYEANSILNPTLPEGTINGTPVTDNSTREMLQEEFDRFSKALILWDRRYLQHFSSPDELKPESVFTFAFECIDNRSQYEVEAESYDDTAWMIPVSVLDSVTEKLFGQVYDYSGLNELKWEETRTASYVTENKENAVYVYQAGGTGVDSTVKPTSYIYLGDLKYQLILSWYEETHEKPTGSNTDWFTVDTNPGFYYVANKWESIVLQKKNNAWQITSYLEN